MSQVDKSSQEQTVEWKYFGAKDKENDAATNARGIKLPPVKTPAVKFNSNRYNTMITKVYELVDAVMKEAQQDGDRESVAWAVELADGIAAVDGNQERPDRVE